MRGIGIYPTRFHAELDTRNLCHDAMVSTRVKNNAANAKRPINDAGLPWYQ